MPETQWGQPMPFEGFPPKPMMNSGQTSLGKRPREDAAVSDWRPPPPPPPPPAMTSHHFPPLQGFPPQPTHPEAGPSRFVRNGAPPHPHVYPPPQEYMQPEPPYPYNPQYMPASGYQAVSHARGTSPGERDVVPLETRLFSGQSAPYPTPAPTMSSITPSSGGSHHHYSGGPVMAPHPRDDLTSPTGPAAVPSSSEKTSSSRPLVKPPGGVSCCRACGTTESPEWRKSESGIKDLCNAYVVQRHLRRMLTCQVWPSLGASSSQERGTAKASKEERQDCADAIAVAGGLRPMHQSDVLWPDACRDACRGQRRFRLRFSISSHPTLRSATASV